MARVTTPCVLGAFWLAGDVRRGRKNSGADTVPQFLAKRVKHQLCGHGFHRSPHRRQCRADSKGPHARHLRCQSKCEWLWRGQRVTGRGVWRPIRRGDRVRRVVRRRDTGRCVNRDRGRCTAEMRLTNDQHAMAQFWCGQEVATGMHAADAHPRRAAVLYTARAAHGGMCVHMRHRTPTAHVPYHTGQPNTQEGLATTAPSATKRCACPVAACRTVSWSLFETRLASTCMGH